MLTSGGSPPIIKLNKKIKLRFQNKVEPNKLKLFISLVLFLYL